MLNSDPCGHDYTAAIAQARAEFLASCPAKEEPQEQPEPAVAPYPLVSVGEVLKCPPLRWRVKGLIPARGIGQILNYPLTAEEQAKLHHSARYLQALAGTVSAQTGLH